MEQLKPKVLIWDLETAGVNALKSDLGFVIIFGWKWLGEAAAHSIVIDKASLKRFDDKRLLQQASKLLQEADITVAHFGSVFDRRFFQGRLLIHGLPPIPPTKMRDTCFIARSVANYSSNRLKHLAKIFNLRHQKLENNWPMAWFRVMQGDMKALAGLATYCEGDVLALEELYLRLLPFDNAHPAIHFGRGSCGHCGGHIQHRGVAYANSLQYQRYVCLSCGKWGRSRTALKEAKWR